jgi:hypothetical protein
MILANRATAWLASANVPKELHVVTCCTCYRFEKRDRDPKVCGDALREHYAVAHPEVAEKRGWDLREGADGATVPGNA